MATIANLVARLTADPTGFVAGMATADGALTGFMTKSTLVKGGLLGIGTVALVVGKQAFDMGLAWDEALDTIQTQTGATGDELEALGQSTLNVYTRIPAELQTVAEAISLINSRLDLTGPELETVTAQLVELSRITGTDLTGNINAVADAMLKWNVPAAEIPGHIDALFRASQATGVPLERLAQLVADNGAALMAFGFTLPETIALMAALEGSGVNTEMAMRGLRTAIGKLADEGVTDAKAGLEGLFTQIKNAPTDFDAAAIAIEYFGTRAGPELAAAIRSGKLSLDEMLDTVANGEGTILGTAEATNDFAEKLQILQNKANALLIPLGTLLVDALTWLADQLLVVADGLSTAKGWFDQLPGPVQTVINTFLMLVNPITRITELIDLHKAAWERLQGPVNSIAGPLENVKNKVGELLTKLQTFGTDAITAVGDLITTLPQKGRDLITGLHNGIIEAWTTVQNWLLYLGTAIFLAIGDLTRTIRQKGLDLLAGLYDGILDKWATVKAWLVSLGVWVYIAIGDVSRIIRQKGLDLLAGLYDGILDKWASVKSWLSGVGGYVSSAVGSLGRVLYSAGSDIMQGLLDGINAGWDSVSSRLSTISGLIPDWKGPPEKDARLLINNGMLIMQGLGKGLDRGWNDVSRQLYGYNAQIGGSISASGENGSGQTVINHNYFVTPEALQQIMRDSKEGAAFARNFGHELGLYAGQP